MSARNIRTTACRVVIVSSRCNVAALVGRVLLDHFRQAGVGSWRAPRSPAPAGRVPRAVEAAGTCCRGCRPASRTIGDDVQLGCVFGVHPAAQALASPPPEYPHRPTLLSAARPNFVAERGAQAVEHPVAGLVRRAPHAVAALVVEGTETTQPSASAAAVSRYSTGQRTERLGAPAQRRTRKHRDDTASMAHW